MSSSSEFEWLVSDVSLKFTDLTCLTLFTDSFYHSTFSSKFFLRIGFVPVFKVLVSDSDRLSSPRFSILSVLQESRRKGCNAYIILLANPLQTTQLLIFGDRYRELDTRAKFLLMNDKRLLKKELNYIWNKLINVVFLRKFTGTKRYELTTVPFPSPIKDNFYVKRLDTWNLGKMQKGVDLYRDKTSDLRDQTLRVVTFPYIPSVVNRSQEDSANITTDPFARYDGLEIMMLKALGEAMRFRPVLVEAEGGAKEGWGHLQIDGSWSGLMGVMTEGRADLALASLHQTPHYLAVMDLTLPYSLHCLTFLTPESTTDSSWKTLFHPFPLSMWLGVIGSLLIITLVLRSLAVADDKWSEDYRNQNRSKFNVTDHTGSGFPVPVVWIRETSTRISPVSGRRTSRRRHIVWTKPPDVENVDSNHDLITEWSGSLLNTWSMLLQVSLSKLPKGISLRVMIGFSWLYFVLITNVYKAAMTAILANPPPRVTIDSLEELASNSLECGGRGEQNRELLLTSLDSASRIVGKRFRVFHDITESGIDLVAKGNFAFYENIYFLKHALATRKRNTTNTGIGEEMHIMSRCVVNMPVSVGLSKNSPLKPRVDVLINRLVEAGLVNKWLADVVQIHRSEDDGSQEALVDLKKLYGAVVLLGTGYLLGFTALAAELLYWRFSVQKSPLFDKYALHLLYANKAKLVNNM